MGSILVTGVAGFIGSGVARALLSRGDRVIGVDNFDPFYARSRKELNLASVRAAAGGGGGLEFVEADIGDEAALRRVCAAHRPDGVIHLAAKAGVRPSIADPVGYTRANVVGTSAVLAASTGVKRIVIASSSSVYGNCPAAPFAETMDVGSPISPYAATKRACELLGHAHHHLTGTPVAMLRFFTVYGPSQRPDLAIAHFMEKIAAGVPIVMFGNGGTSRDYTYIDDIVAGVLAAYDRVDRFGFRVWNLGNSAPVTLQDMIATIERVMGRRATIRHEPASLGDVERTFADLTRARAELGFNPRTRFEEGVARQWAWTREHLRA